MDYQACMCKKEDANIAQVDVDLFAPQQKPLIIITDHCIATSWFHLKY